MELFSAVWDDPRGWRSPLPVVDGPATLVLVFADSAVLDDPAPVEEVLAAFPRSTVIGCSTAGQILDDTIDDHTVTVVVARFARTRLVSAVEPLADVEDSFAAGQRLIRRLTAADPDLAAVFVLSDGMTVNGSALAAGLMHGAPRAIPITGGLAGDDNRFTRTWVLADGALRSGHVAAVGLAGPDLRVGCSSRSGWEAFGPRRLVTRARGNVLYALDDQPALELYKHYLGDRAQGLPATGLLFPLAVEIPGAEGGDVVRTVLSVDEDGQSMTFAGDVPQGATVQLMHGSLDRLVAGAGEAAVRALPTQRPAPDEPVLAVAVSCIGRRLVLGRRAEDEIEAVLADLPSGTTLAGFYSYGELSPLAPGRCDLHNQTMTLTTVFEAG